MEFPEPTIDVELAASDLKLTLPLSNDAQTNESREFAPALQALLAQAWEEGRWSPPGACLNPYGEPAASQPVVADRAGFPGLRLLRLRTAAQAALAWVENMAPTVRRTALANQLRDALGGK